MKSGSINVRLLSFKLKIIIFEKCRNTWLFLQQASCIVSTRTKIPGVHKLIKTAEGLSYIAFTQIGYAYQPDNRVAGSGFIIESFF